MSSRGLSSSSVSASDEHLQQQKQQQQREVSELTTRVVNDLSGAVAVQLMYIGDRLGLFKVLAEALVGMTSAELANKADCNLRYVETWCQACVSHSFMETEVVVTSGTGTNLEDGKRRYWMTFAQQQVLAVEGGRSFQCGAAQYISASAQVTPAMIERGFRCLHGGGLSWEELGQDAREGVARMNGVTLRDLLPSWIGSMPEGARALSNSGARILDVGCGFGLSTLAVAAAFPDASVVGLDPDSASISGAREELARRPSLGNVRFEERGLEDIGELMKGGFDVILAYDCIHDLPDPFKSLELCRRLLRRDASAASSVGVLLWFEPHGSDDPYQNREIMGARMVAGIALNCVTTSMATGGAGLGAHGCTPAKAEALARSAGFQYFRQEQNLKGAQYRNNVYILH